MAGLLGSVTPNEPPYSRPLSSTTAAIPQSTRYHRYPANSYVEGYASGTLYAERGLAIVGEEGPELISFRGGEQVFTAPETERMLTQRSSSEPFFYLPENDGFMDAHSEERVSRSEKKITIEIEGSGEIRVGGDMDEEGVLQILMNNIRPALLSIVRQEIFVEGGFAVDY
jgi:hypothetical protein